MRKTLLLFIVASLGFMVSCTSKEEKMQGLAGQLHKSVDAHNLPN